MPADRHARVTTRPVFEREAAHYESWYATPAGRRIDEAERTLIEWLLSGLAASRVVLDVGCGSGHFLGWLAETGRRVVGLDRSPAMLAEARRRLPIASLLLGDAHRLPLRDRSVDVVMLVATLEFLENPGVALAEAARVARHGIAVVALHRWSVGGMSRRWGRQRTSPILGIARDFSRRSLRRALLDAAGSRLVDIRCRGALFPGGLCRRRLPVTFGGDVLGMAAGLSDAGGGDQVPVGNPRAP